MLLLVLVEKIESEIKSKIQNLIFVGTFWKEKQSDLVKQWIKLLCSLKEEDPNSQMEYSRKTGR